MPKTVPFDFCSDDTILRFLFRQFSGVWLKQAREELEFFGLVGV